MRFHLITQSTHSHLHPPTPTPSPTPRNGQQVGKGDLVTFPEGMGCTWEVHEAIKKHYKFH